MDILAPKWMNLEE